MPSAFAGLLDNWSDPLDVTTDEDMIRVHKLLGFSVSGKPLREWTRDELKAGYGSRMIWEYRRAIRNEWDRRAGRPRGGLGFLIDRRLPPGKCALAMRSDGSTTEFCNPKPPKSPKRKKRAKAGKKRTWEFTNGGRASVRTRGRVHYVYRRYPRSKRWVQVFKYHDLAKAQRAAARWGTLRGR